MGCLTMNDDYINQFGSNRNNSNLEDSKLCYVPLVMGVICIVIFAICLLSAFNGNGAAMALVVFVPILSIIGLIFSIITRSIRDYRYKLWFFGLISCALSLFLSILLYFASWFALAQH